MVVLGGVLGLSQCVDSVSDRDLRMSNDRRDERGEDECGKAYMLDSKVEVIGW